MAIRGKIRIRHLPLEIEFLCLLIPQIDPPWPLYWRLAKGLA
jgi:hypothetical protein